MSRWTYRWAICVSFAGLLVGRATDPPNDAAKLAEPRKKPITTAKGEIGDLLTKWWADGTAAGNVGDFYDNRDGGHSDLDTAPYPQLQRIVYSDDDVKNHRHWALTVATRPHVTFGNSSTSAPPTLGGSNPRHAYCSTAGARTTRPAVPRQQRLHLSRASRSPPRPQRQGRFLRRPLPDQHAVPHHLARLLRLRPAVHARHPVHARRLPPRGEKEARGQRPPDADPANDPALDEQAPRRPEGVPYWQGAPAGV